MTRIRRNAVSLTACLVAFAAVCALPSPARAQAERADPCARDADAAACARSREWRRVEAWATRVKREGASLSLRLDDGRGVTMTDRVRGPLADSSAAPQDRPVTYVFRDYLPRANAYVVQARFDEGGAWVLVDAGSGRQTPVNGEPVFSPDGRRFVEASQAGDTGFDPAQISVWRMAEGGPVREFQAKPAAPESWDPADPVWTSSSTIRFVRRTADRAGFSLRETAAVLRLGAVGWEMAAAR